MGGSSRWVELGSGQVRDPENNAATRCATHFQRHANPRLAFEATYARMREVSLSYDRAGVAVFAVEARGGRYLGAMCLPSQHGPPQTGVVGRHSQSPLLVDCDASLALRQLLFVVEAPGLAGDIRGDVRFRLLDLGSQSPPRDEDGRVVASLVAEGPMILYVGGVVVFALPTGDPTDWPERAHDAWACFPERIYFEERLAEGSAPRALPRHDPRHTRVTVRQPPAPLAPRLDDGPPIGHLHVRADGKSTHFPISAEALQRGVLVGRYARCQAGALAFGDDDRVSRVHACLLEVDGMPWLIDTASTNGLWFRGKQRDCVHLLPGTVVQLGENADDATIVWES